MNYALIKDGVVKNVVVFKEEPPDMPAFDYVICIDSYDPKPGPKWTYDSESGAFTAPDVPAHENKYKMIKDIGVDIDALETNNTGKAILALLCYALSATPEQIKAGITFDFYAERVQVQRLGCVCYAIHEAQRVDVCKRIINSVDIIA